jgi:hypothetical protein
MAESIAKRRENIVNNMTVRVYAKLMLDRNRSLCTDVEHKLIKWIILLLAAMSKTSTFYSTILSAFCEFKNLFEKSNEMILFLYVGTPIECHDTKMVWPFVRCI